MTDYKDIKYDFSGENLTDVTVSPTISSITPSSTTEGALPLGSVVIVGTNFTSNSTVTLISASGTSVVCPSVAFDSVTQLTVTIPTGVGGQDEDPWDVSVENPVIGQGDNLFSIDDNPIFTTAAGTLGTIIDVARAAPAYTLSTAAATDPEGTPLTYALVAPGPAVSPGLSFDTTNAAITGDANAAGSDTTTTFTVRATAGAQTSDREFSILVKAPVQAYFTTAGTATEVMPFAANIKVLVVGGGGSGDGAGHAGGGGGGGLIVHPSYAITPGTYSYYIGAGGQASAPSTSGENSNWNLGTEPASTTSTILTAIGGGQGSTTPASDGGSGGGWSHSGSPVGGATLQVNSPLISADAKTYGFGFAGGGAPYSTPSHPSGGGGGAGAIGQGGSGGSAGGAGGAGKDVGSDFGTAQGSPGGHFAGGGGGGTHLGGSGGAGANGGGSGGSAAGLGNAATAITGSGGGAGGAGGNGVIAIVY